MANLGYGRCLRTGQDTETKQANLGVDSPRVVLFDHGFTGNTTICDGPIAMAWTIHHSARPSRPCQGVAPGSCRWCRIHARGAVPIRPVRRQQIESIGLCSGAEIPLQRVDRARATATTTASGCGVASLFVPGSCVDDQHRSGVPAAQQIWVGRGAVEPWLSRIESYTS